ncbi:hypothetical protein LCGC14_3132660, partial [marine sediment metagenome]
MSRKTITKSIDTENEWSNSATLTGYFNLSLSGT